MDLWTCKSRFRNDRWFDISDFISGKHRRRDRLSRKVPVNWQIIVLHFFSVGIWRFFKRRIRIVDNARSNFPRFPDKRASVQSPKNISGGDVYLLFNVEIGCMMSPNISFPHINNTMQQHTTAMAIPMRGFMSALFKLLLEKKCMAIKWIFTSVLINHRFIWEIICYHATPRASFVQDISYLDFLIYNKRLSLFSPVLM